MKKLLLMAALCCACAGANAQQTYNYFDAEDVDADGWLWLDSSAKLNKYCNYTQTAKIQLTEAGYEDVDFTYPAATKNATIKGYNAEGVKGGEGSKTGGIVLPMAKDFHYIMNNKSFGGGVAFHLPDLAELSLYISLDQKEAFMAVYDAAGDVRYQDTNCLVNYMHGEGLASLHNPVPGISYCGTWSNLQNISLEDPYTPGQFNEIPHAPGKAVTVYLPSLTDGHEIIIHGIKLLTYTNTVDNSAVDEIYSADDENAPAYNLMGVPVNDNYKGIVIKNGKKEIRR